MGNGVEGERTANSGNAVISASSAGACATVQPDDDQALVLNQVASAVQAVRKGGRKVPHRMPASTVGIERAKHLSACLHRNALKKVFSFLPAKTDRKRKKVFQSFRRVK